jgi:hypothetical protein
MRTLLVSGILILFILVQLWQGVDAKKNIDGDGSGYYAYLPTVLHYKTTDFRQVFNYEKSRRGLDYMGHYFHEYNGKIVNKYYMGTALLILPFYLLAMLYSKIAFLPLDGYNIIFQYAVGLAAAFYLALGLLLTNALLRTYSIQKPVRLLVMLSLMLGTNLFYYAFLHPSHSHVYSFAAIAGFAYFARNFMLAGRSRHLYGMAFVFGLVGLIRPTNLLLILLIPFFADDYDQFKDRLSNLFSKPITVIWAGVAFCLSFGLQPLFNFIQTGDFVLYTYKNEGFHFLNPAFLSFLLSYRKGFFLYTPLMLLIFSGFMVLYRRSKYQFYGISGFFIVLIYVLSSWWNWFFGDSFGMRAMIDYYPICAILLGLGFTSLTKLKTGRIFLTLFLMLVVPLNLIQAYQYERGIIHPDSMTKEKYWYVFLKTGKNYEQVLGGQPEPMFESLKTYQRLDYFMDMETVSPLWTNNGIKLSGESYSGMYLAELNDTIVYSPTLVLNGSQIIEMSGPCYVAANLMYRELETNAAAHALVVYAATNRNNQLVFYKVQKLKQMPDDITNSWRHGTYGMKVPSWHDEVAQVKVYVWNTEAKLFQLDDLAVSVYYKPLNDADL